MRKGFTLIELIFVIIIIGILAGVALPKYKGMKENAEVTNVFKVVQDAVSSVPPAYLNLEDLNGTQANIDQIFEVKGSPYWSTAASFKKNGTTVNYPAWVYNNPSRNDLNATIGIDNGSTPPQLYVEITVNNDSNNIKYQKLKRLVVGSSGTFNGDYNATIDLQ
ncbi:prepilin-type N-terminal cleavage/methylation domain-containing protein [Hydrogenimonas sp. SS33]|uniref:prepilin-type N-terminal cleavage/methylation domain-containing protein n=1 Tax=Hydrogenimonas leucolamina TaxID=2954236 RepID=UPI00336BE9F2